MNVHSFVRCAIGAVVAAPLLSLAQSVSASGEPLDGVAQKPAFGNEGERRRLAAEGVVFWSDFIAQPGVNDRGIHGSGTT